jgi:CheY-like chemotaxis protein
MPLVLSIGADPSLMRTRQLILEHEGHTVVGVTDEKALMAACELHSFDVAILSQTLSPKIKQHIVTLIRSHFRASKYWNSILLRMDAPLTAQIHGLKFLSICQMNFPYA